MVDAIYIHIPFCLKKCDYCDFLSFRYSKIEKTRYVDAILKEITLYPKNRYSTVYFGGGTPSLLEPEEINKILSVLDLEKGAEITLEVNPRTVTKEKLKNFKKYGINRLSIGIQTFNKKQLQLLGRLHTVREGIETYFQAREVGFDNISLDLMFSLPTQTLDDLKQDLKHLFVLKPEHFSIYSLIWEEGTEFFKKLENGIFKETENELEAQMYEYIIDESIKNGYIHYEISNFSLPKKEAKHNIKYWKNKRYLGIGIGASGYIENIRYKNVLNFDDYYDKIYSGERAISEVEEVNCELSESYQCILGLRLLQDGILPTNEKYIDIFQQLEKDKFLKKNGERYVLTRKGLLLANDIFDKFI